MSRDVDRFEFEEVETSPQLFDLKISIPKSIFVNGIKFLLTTKQMYSIINVGSEQRLTNEDLEWKGGSYGTDVPAERDLQLHQGIYQREGLSPFGKGDR